MRRPFLLLALLLPSLAAAEVYKWQDEQGRWHYGDAPARGAQPVELPPLQVYQSPPLPVVEPPAAREESQEAELSYARVEILSPTQEQTIRSAAGEVGINIALEPSLRPDHRIRLLIDGAPIGDPATTTAFTLGNVDRGAHTVAVEVLDRDGQVIARAGPQTFYLHRPSRLH